MVISSQTRQVHHDVAFINGSDKPLITGTNRTTVPFNNRQPGILEVAVSILRTDNICSAWRNNLENTISA